MSFLWHSQKHQSSLENEMQTEAYSFNKCTDWNSNCTVSRLETNQCSNL